MSKFIKMKTQICTKCGIKKPISEFHKDKNSKSGYCYYCKLCVSKQKHEYYLEHQEEIKNREKQYQQKNKEKIKKRKHIHYSNHKERILLKFKGAEAPFFNLFNSIF